MATDKTDLFYGLRKRTLESNIKDASNKVTELRNEIAHDEKVSKGAGIAASVLLPVGVASLALGFTVAPVFGALSVIPMGLSVLAAYDKRYADYNVSERTAQLAKIEQKMGFDKMELGYIGATQSKVIKPLEGDLFLADLPQEIDGEARATGETITEVADNHRQKFAAHLIVEGLKSGKYVDQNGDPLVIDGISQEEGTITHGASDETVAHVNGAIPTESTNMTLDTIKQQPVAPIIEQ